MSVGFLGAGFIARLHAELLKSSGEDFEWAGVYDPDPARAGDFASSYGASQCATEAEVLDTCDAVYVCTWTSEHRRLVEAAAGRSLSVFCEKPLSTDLAGATAMTRAVQKAGVVNQVGLVLRYAPPLMLLRDIVGDPRAGRVMNVVLRDDQYIPLQGIYASTWRCDRHRAGSGTLLEHSIHDLDLLEHLIGEVTRISATAANFHGHAGIEDSVSAMLTFAGGASGVMCSVWHDVLERNSSRRLEVLCERLHVALENEMWGPVTWTFTGEESRSVERAELYEEVVRRGLDLGNPDAAFVRSVSSHSPAKPDFTEALRAHLLTDAAYRSAASGGAPVAVPGRSQGEGA